MSTSWLKRSLAGIALVALVASVFAPVGALAATRGVPMGATAAMSATAEDDTIPGYFTDGDAVWYTGTGSYTDSVNAATDADDVYAVWLSAGESLDVTLTATAPGAYRLRGYPPSAEDLTDTPWFDESSPAPASLQGSLFAQRAGYYFVDVHADSDGGEYTLELNVSRHDTDVRFTSSGGTLGFLGQPTIRGSVVDLRSDPEVTADGMINLFYSFDGLDWIPLENQHYMGGQFEFKGLEQWRKTYYMVVFEGSDRFVTNSEVTKPYATKAGLLDPVAPSTMYKGKAKTIYGYIWPRHTAGSYPVRIYRYKKVSGSWKSYGYVKAKASTIDDWTSKYSASVSFPSRGSWKVRAYAPADSQHAATWSYGYDYVTVK